MLGGSSCNPGLGQKAISWLYGSRLAPCYPTCLVWYDNKAGRWLKSEYPSVIASGVFGCIPYITTSHRKVRSTAPFRLTTRTVIRVTGVLIGGAAIAYVKHGSMK